MSPAGSGFSSVLITRPRDKAERLAGLLSTMGIDSIVQPAQDFKARTLGASELEGLAELPAPVLLVFTSPRAVEYGLPQLPRALLSGATVAAIGPATSYALAAAGFPAAVEPDDGYTSESLLETLAAKPGASGGTALVVCAPGGRDALVQGLTSQGWRASPLWVYERLGAEIRNQSLEAISGADRLLTVFTSAEAMESLSRRLPPAAWFAICRGEWLVISERQVRLARAYGPSAVHLASGPGNAELATAIRSLN